ncbi:hypothetical protein GmHk_14G040754 [Glycine max]|nr:hypothetical protein GmHk_14G040754 [Glycine max]
MQRGPQMMSALTGHVAHQGIPQQQHQHLTPQHDQHPLRPHASQVPPQPHQDIISHVMCIRSHLMNSLSTG